MTRVAVIMGGWSSERPVSLSSGKGMAEAARQAGFEAIEVDVTRQLAEQCLATIGFDKKVTDAEGKLISNPNNTQMAMAFARRA